MLRRLLTAQLLRRLPIICDDIPSPCFRTNKRAPKTIKVICLTMCPIQTTDAANPYYYKTRRGSSTWSHSKTKGCCHANFFQKKLYLHQIILLINLLQLRHLKSQITFHPFVLLYNNYTLHHSYKKTVKKT